MIHKTYIEFLVKHKLSANQLLLMWCLTNQEQKILNSYLTEVGLLNSDVKDLINKGYIINDEGEPYNIENLYPSLEFQELILLDPEEAAMQVWNSWYKGKIIIVNGKEYSSKGLDVDDFVLTYNKIIKGNLLEHFRISNITKNYVNSNPECKMTLRKYIGSRYYDDIEEKYGKKYTGKSNFIKDV